MGYEADLIVFVLRDLMGEAEENPREPARGARATVQRKLQNPG